MSPPDNTDGTGSDPGDSIDGSNEFARREQEIRRAIEQAREGKDAVGLALRHAEMAVLMGHGQRWQEAVAEARTSLGYVELLQADGEQQVERLLKMTTAASPPPGESDVDLARLEVELRVLVAEFLAAGGQLQQAADASAEARPLVKGFFRRKLRHRLDAVDAAAAAGSVGDTSARQLETHITHEEDPARQRALRLQLAGRLLDSGQFDEATRQSLLLVRDSDAADDVVTRAGARQVLGLALEGAGHDEDAVLALGEAFRDLAGHGQDAAVVGMGEALAARLARSDDQDGALTVLHTAEAAARRIGDEPASVALLIAAAGQTERSGDLPGARTAFDEAIVRARDTGQDTARANAQHGLAVLLATRLSDRDDEVVEAISLLDDCRSVYLEYGMAAESAGCDHEAAALLARRASHRAARARYEAALASYQAIPADQRDEQWRADAADCTANVTVLDVLDREPGTVIPAGAFASGGHTMEHDAQWARGLG